MTMIAALILAVASIFNGCEKKVEVEATAVQVRPFAVMIPVNTSTILSAYFEPSNATNCAMTWTTWNYIATAKPLNGDNTKVLVTAHEIGGTNVYGKTKNGDLSTYTELIVIPVENENDYATLVPRFYIGAFNEQYMVGGIEYLTVRYHSKNKITLSIQKNISLYDLGIENCYINIEYYNVEITKINNNTYSSVGEIYVSIKDKYYPADIEATFSDNKLDLIIKIKNVPEMEEIVIHFKGNGSFTVGEGTGIWHC